MEQNEVYIKQATKQGFIKCIVGGGQRIYPTPTARQDAVEYKKAV